MREGLRSGPSPVLPVHLLHAAEQGGGGARDTHAGGSQTRQGQDDLWQPGDDLRVAQRVSQFGHQVPQGGLQKILQIIKYRLQNQLIMNL